MKVLKAFREWLLALGLFVSIEAAVHLFAPSPDADATNFLQFGYAVPEPAQRLFVFHKLRYFAKAQPMIVQSGDSSGFYGIDPRVVERHLPPGQKYLNMSCCANLGFRGYYNIFEYMAQHNASIRFNVLHITPYTMPRPETWDTDGANLWGDRGLEVFGKAVGKEFVSPNPLMHPPTLGYRQTVTNFVYYFGPLLAHIERARGRVVVETSADDPPVDVLRLLDNNKPYLDFLATYRESRGWTPEMDQRSGVYAVECDMPTPQFFDYGTWSHKTYLEDVFDSFAEQARRNHATLVIVFQPVACVLGTGTKNADARAAVERFKKSNPDVEIPFPLIETWPDSIFSVPAHVRREHTDLIGNRLGKAMADVIARHP